MNITRPLLADDAASLTPEEVRRRGTLKAPEVAAYCGISLKSVYELAKSGELPTARLGRRIVFPVNPLLRMLGEDVVTVTPPTARRLDIQGNYAGPVLVSPVLGN